MVCGPEGDLAAIDADLKRIGVDPAHPTPSALAAHDQFHAGLDQGTARLCDWAGIAAGSRVIDLGAGLGGTARQLALDRGCRVEAIDLCAVGRVSPPCCRRWITPS